MSFDRREHARRYSPREGDTLQLIAERETAAGNPVTWQELARFNWGTDAPREVEAHLRDELGCRKRDAANHFVVSTDDVPRGELLIPLPFEKPGLSLNRTYTLRVRRKRCPEQFLGCCSLPSVTFASDSSFVRPTVVEHLRPLAALAAAHPAARIMIFGHADAVGDELHNKKLSERRAWSVHAFITDDVAAWETLYNHDDEAWGVPVVQEILLALGHDPGPPDGDWNPATRDAARAFLGAPAGAPVANDAAFRARLFAAYMSGTRDVEIPRERFMAPGYMGCGEFNPLEATEAAHEANRRVTFFFFHPDRLPNLPCAFADVAPCKRQMVTLDVRHRTSFRCSFYDSWAATCPGEGQVVATLRILYHVPPELEQYWRPLAEWYSLLSTDGAYACRKDAADAARIDDEHFAIDFERVPPGKSYTLTRHFQEGSSFLEFADVPFAAIEAACAGGRCEDVASTEAQGASADDGLTPEERELFGAYDVERFLADSLDAGEDEVLDPRDYA